jgi:Ca-activated chloride channel homolog
LMNYQTVLIAALFTLPFSNLTLGQAGKRVAPAGERIVTMNITAEPASPSEERLEAGKLAIYDSGIEQTIQSLQQDQSPSRLVLLIDNSLSLRTDQKKISQAVKEFSYEIYEGDQLFLVGYDTKPEILETWTDDPAKIEKALTLIRKQGEPHLFDSLNTVMDEALIPLSGEISKRVIVLISDGLDRGSKQRFEQVLKKLQSYDIVVYALQIQDRTSGAFRRDQIKPKLVIEQVTEKTGGRIFQLDQAKEAAKAICDELKKNRYVVSYQPRNITATESRRLLVVGDSGLTVRHKTEHPPR